MGYMVFYKANQEYNANLSSDYTVGDTILAVSSIPTNTPTIVSVARGTDKETRFTVTGTGVGQLTGVARLDGANTNIPAGSSVEVIVDADFLNQISTAVFTQNTLKNLVYAADGGSNDTYVISLPVAPTAYSEILGLPIAFRANTPNTGAATLNVNTLGAKTIKKDGSLDLETGDIADDQIVIVVYDGTNFQLQTTPPVRFHELIFQVFPGDYDVETGDGKLYFPIPTKLNGYNLTAVHAKAITAGTTGTTDIQIHNVTQAADMLSTKLTIDSGEIGSDTAATPAVIDTNNDDVATNDTIRIDIDAVSTTPPSGLLLRLGFTKP
jgi:hypothetical protein